MRDMSHAYKSFWSIEGKRWVRRYVSLYAYVMRKHLNRSKY